jgi:hypothetical protein
MRLRPLAALLLFAALTPASARMHSPYRGHRIVAANAVPPPLDGMTAPSGAYSFRKLKSTYAGPAIRLRRASDNAETDIAFLGCTSFTGCPWDVAAATAHCAATSCFITKWYDQSGAARDLVQATPAAQPSLIFNCDGALPCLEHPSSAATNLSSAALFTPATGLVSFSGVGRRSLALSGCTLLRENVVNNRIMAVGAAGTWQLTGGTSGAVVATGVAEGAWHAAQGVINGASSVLGVDGVETTGTTVGNVTAGLTQTAGTGTGTACGVAEVVFWDNYGLTAGERAVLAANQRSFWGTP